MPQVKYLDKVLRFVDYVINQDWTMDQFANLGAPTNGANHARKARKQIQVVKQSATETRCCLSIILGDMADDFSEIV